MPDKIVMWKAIYCNEASADAMHDAIVELINAHPEWDADIDADWDCEVVDAGGTITTT